MKNALKRIFVLYLIVLYTSLSAQTKHTDFLKSSPAIGQIVHSYKMESKQGNNHLFFSSSLFPTGLYTLRIKQGRTTTTEKVVIK